MACMSESMFLCVLPPLTLFEINLLWMFIYWNKIERKSSESLFNSTKRGILLYVAHCNFNFLAQSSFFTLLHHNTAGVKCNFVCTIFEVTMHCSYFFLYFHTSPNKIFIIMIFVLMNNWLIMCVWMYLYCVCVSVYVYRKCDVRDFHNNDCGIFHHYYCCCCCCNK
jgi:hypothetical protein